MGKLVGLKRKRQKGNSSVPVAVPAVPRSVENLRTTKRPLQPRRARVFAFLTVTLTPILAALVLELALRFAGYGHPSSFFLRQQIQGHSMLVENAWFAQRFFPPGLARSP